MNLHCIEHFRFFICDNFLIKEKHVSIEYSSNQIKWIVFVTEGGYSLDEMGELWESYISYTKVLIKSHSTMILVRFTLRSGESYR